MKQQPDELADIQTDADSTAKTNDACSSSSRRMIAICERQYNSSLHELGSS